MPWIFNGLLGDECKRSLDLKRPSNQPEISDNNCRIIDTRTREFGATVAIVLDRMAQLEHLFGMNSTNSSEPPSSDSPSSTAGSGNPPRETTK